MLIYAYLIFTCFIAALIEKKITKNSQFVFFLFLIVNLAVISGFRSTAIGTDTKMYGNIFQSIGKNINSIYMPMVPLYTTLTLLVFKLSQDYNLFLLIVSLLTNISIGIFIWKNSPQPIFSLLLYLLLYHYFSSMNIFRQYFGMSIALLGFAALRNHKILIFILFVILGSMIHNTIIIFLLFIPLRLIKWNIKLFILFSILLIVSFLFINVIVNLFVVIFPKYNSYLDASRGYFGANTSEGKKIILSLFFLGILLKSFIKMKLHKIQNPFKSDYFFPAIILVASIIGIIFYNNLLFSRIESYFSVFFVLFIPYVSERLVKQKFIFKLTIIFILFIPFLIQLLSNRSDVVPYQFHSFFYMY